MNLQCEGRYNKRNVNKIMCTVLKQLFRLSLIGNFTRSTPRIQIFSLFYHSSKITSEMYQYIHIKRARVKLNVARKWI